MTEVNMFEVASRTKMRFESPMGALTVEDLWDLPLTHRSRFDLDTLARNINRQVKDAEEESFVVQRSSASSKLKLQFDIVKHVIDVKLEERDAAKVKKEEAEKRQRVMEILERRKDEKLETMSDEELEAMLKA